MKLKRTCCDRREGSVDVPFIVMLLLAFAVTLVPTLARGTRWCNDKVELNARLERCCVR